MIIVAPNFESAGPWKLPAEMTSPNHYMLESPSAQQILEARGLSGYGAATSPYAFPNRGLFPVSSGIQFIPKNPMAGYGRMTWAQYANRVLIP